MFVKNFYTILKNGLVTYLEWSSGMQVTLTSTNGSEETFSLADVARFYCNLDYFYPSNSFGAGYSQKSSEIHFGSGDTPPTINDYKLDTLIDSSIYEKLSYSTTNFTKQTENGQYYTDKQINIVNKSTSSVTIKEVALVLGSVSQLYKYPREACIIYRDVLQTPLVIPAAGIGTLHISIIPSISIPTP